MNRNNKNFSNTDIQKYHLRLRDLREDHDLTQQQCADIALISKNSYIRYENNERKIPFSLAITFAEYYGVSLEYLAGLTNENRRIS